MTPSRLRQVTTFGLISVATTLLDFGLFNLLVATEALSVVSANTVGYSAGIVASYVLNKTLTFQGGGRASRTHEFILFVAINIFGLLVNNAAVAAADSVSGSTLVLNGAKLAAGVATWVLKFVAFERWVYPTRSKAEGPPPAF